MFEQMWMVNTFLLTQVEQKNDRLNEKSVGFHFRNVFQRERLSIEEE